MKPKMLNNRGQTTFLQRRLAWRWASWLKWCNNVLMRNGKHQITQSLERVRAASAHRSRSAKFDRHHSRFPGHLVKDEAGPPFSLALDLS